MSEHEHMPPTKRDTARPIHGGNVVITLDGRESEKTWGEAWALAQSLITALDAGGR